MGTRRVIRRSLLRAVIAIVIVAFAVPVDVFAQTVSIDAGAHWQIGDAVVDMDCAALNVAGTLDAQNGEVDGIGDLDIAGALSAATATFEVGGNWNNHGAFAAGAGTVRFSDRCGAAQATIGGASTFANLIVESAAGKAYRFPAGLTQTVAQSLHLAGASGQLLPIRSTQSGVRASLALSQAGGQQIAWVDVADMEAPAGSAWLAPGLAATFHSVDSGNNVRWFVLAPQAATIPAPATSPWALFALALALGLLGRRRLWRY